MNWEVVDQHNQQARIKVIGVGGAGGNAVIHMINHDIQGVDFICANTDTQALARADGAISLKLGSNLTKGLGAGANPEVGRQAAEGDREAIQELLGDADMIFITAGMGGGTGTGAAPVVASIAKEMGALTVAVVTKPFKFEGKRRMSSAEQGLAALVEEVDSLITIPNQRLIEVLGGNTTMTDAFAKADDVLKGAVQGISDIIMKDGLINVDFNDVRTVMSEKGIAMMGTGRSSGKDRASEAASQAVGSELLEDIDLKDARGVLVNITGKEPTLNDYEEVSNIVEKFTAEDAYVIYGTVIDKDIDDDLLVTIVATGVNQKAPTLAVDNKRSASIKLNPVGLGKEAQVNNTSQEVGTSSAEALDFLDVPTFMRKQVD
jgi:cell division protein FtsZ